MKGIGTQAAAAIQDPAIQDQGPMPDDCNSASADGRTLRRNLEIVNKRGLHARASARFVQTAEAFNADLTISRDGISVGGRSIMGLMMLAASQGTTIEIQAAGPEARAALDAIEQLVATRFGEEC